MRLLTASWLVCLCVCVVVVASATRVQLNANLFAVRGISTSGLGFSTAVEEPVPQSLLASVEYGTSANNQNLIKCDVLETTNNSGQATVLVAISKCLNASAIALIGSWVDTIKASKLEYVENGIKKKLTFASTLISGECTALSEGEKRGINDTSPYKAALLSEEVQPEEMERIQAFARFGRVLAEAPSAWNAVPIAVISFVNNRKSHDVITQYENRFNISKTFRFQFCQDANCSDRYPNSVALTENVDLFMYNPFQLARSYYCGQLRDGIPLEYVTTKGSRECLCTCTAASHIEDTGYGKSCVSTEPEECLCSWNTMGGFVVTNYEKLAQCKLSNLATSRGLPVPDPHDNYVANKQNADELTTGPRIELTVASLYSTVYEYIGTTTVVNTVDLPEQATEMLKQLGQANTRVISKPTVLRGQNDTKKFTWLDYRQNGKAKIDELTMTAYGEYELVLAAYDYSNKPAQCVGCVVVVDGYRPKHTTQCPAPCRDNVTTAQPLGVTPELTAANVAKMGKLVSEFYDFQTKAVNDACSPDVKTRCDYQDFKLKTLFSANYITKTMADGKTCFSTSEIDADLIKNGTTNPLETKTRDGTACQDINFVAPTECTRCCKYETRLQEYWTDYRCGYDYSMQYCSGDAEEKCAFQQCLVLRGSSIATVSASIKPAIVTNSAALISTLPSKTGFQTTTQIHRSLTCYLWSTTCSYTTTLAQLLDVSVVNKLGGATPTLVFWRYKLDCDTVGWRLWNPTSGTQVQHTIKDSTVTVTLEAWTACGLAYKTTFTIYVWVSGGGKLKLATVANSSESTTSSTTTPALLAVSAVVVAATLLAVRRRWLREANSEAAVAMENAYKPLLG